jgi:hypothetical protein
MLTDRIRRERFESLRSELRVRIDAVSAGADVVLAKAELDAADLAYKQARFETAWVLLKAAIRAEILVGDATRLRVEAMAVQAETEAKLTSWRKQTASVAASAAIKLLDDARTANKTPPLDEVRRFLDEALKQRDEHLNNVFRRNAIVRRLLTITAVMVFGGLVLLYLGSIYLTELLGSPKQLLLAMLMGAIGALVSIAASLVGDPVRERRLPEYAATLDITVVRPIYGAAFGVVIWLLANASIVTLFKGEPKALAVVALFAGYSERWFLRIVDGSIASKEKAG